MFLRPYGQQYQGKNTNSEFAALVQKPLQHSSASAAQGYIGIELQQKQKNLI